MRGLARISNLHHGLVALTVLGAGGAGAAGLFTRAWTETFDAKTVVVQPAGTDGLRLTEYVDMNFGTAKNRHGYRRLIPNDFGAATDVTASSPDAPDDLAVRTRSFDTEIRVGSPSVTVSGQHRYVLSYTLPQARLSTGQLALDVIGNDETDETKRFEVIVTGLELQNPQCNVGRSSSSGGCTLEPVTIAGQPAYRAVISPLKPKDGITIGGTVVGRTTPAAVPVPGLPARDDRLRPDVGAMMLALGGATSLAIYGVARRMGSNEVAGAAAADAAYGGASPFDRLPPPGGFTEATSAWKPPQPATAAAPPTTSRAMPRTVQRVTDAQLARMATVEFVPPRGIDPWEGQAILAESQTPATVGAWFSGLAARDVISISNATGQTVIRLGPQASSLRGEEAQLLLQAFDGRSEIVLGKYDKDFAKAWRGVQAYQSERLAGSGFWTRFGPSGLVGSGLASAATSIGLLVAGLAALGFLAVRLGLVGWLGAAVVAVLASGLSAGLLYRVLLPARSSVGSALALRTESFRRFLAASEAKHVEWAWQHGLLREYSAWAVALGEAGAWSRAMEASGAIPPEELHNGPLVIWSSGPSITHSVQPPPSQGGGGGGFGGFSGGSVGGGGGGGSSGSW